MTRLDSWLLQATRGLSKDSAAQVRAEIQEHYRSAHDDATAGGTISDEADRLAVTALGDAKMANRQYRGVLLTSGEVRMLRDAKWEARAICSRLWLWWLLLPVPVAAFLGAAGFYVMGIPAVGRTLLAAGILMGFLFAMPFLPVYTLSRARLFRGVKWVVVIGMLLLAFGPLALKWSWLLACSLWPMFWIERTRISIRRKLRVADWPKSLYL
jgi:hypothetical protein